ncbi:MarR family transcriptional regulator [Flavobacteriaceae bacterium]|nr:MarR family transcriptional regulator [Flavobacteriaceae bacterium]
MADLGKEIKSRFQSEGHKALLNVKYTASYINSLGEGILKPFKISTAQYNILRILRGAGEEPLAASEIKNRMIEKSPNTTRLIDKLLVKGLVSRYKCESDRRVVYVQITEKGLQMLEAIKLDNFDVFYTRLTEDEYKTLNDLLDKVRG